MSEVVVPILGESIVEASILSWLKSEGEAVRAGEALAELETDKVNIEVIASEDGVLGPLLKQAGDTVQIGEVITSILPKHGALTADSGSTDAAGATTHATTPATTPGTNSAGMPTASVPLQEQISPGLWPATSAGQTSLALSRTTPSMRRLALDNTFDGPFRPGVDTAVPLTHQSHQSQTIQTQSVQAVTQNETEQRPVVTRADEERVRMSRRRQTIARRLVEVQHTAAMLTTFNEVDMTAIMDVRKRRKDKFKDVHGIGLGFMSFFTKAVVGGLKEFPRLNAEIQGDEMILKYHYDIGIAVSSEGGLVVPVVRDVDRLSFAEIETEIATLAERARKNTLSLQDLQGGTFTITNGGVFGSLLSTPILNAPQVGILGMHGIQQRPVAVNGQVEIRPMMYVALSYDHRIVDGSEAVQFLVRVKEMLEDTESLLLEG